MLRARVFTGLSSLVVAFGCFSPAQALPPTADLTLRYEHYLFTITAKDQKPWQSPHEVWVFDGREITPPPNLRVDGDTLPPLPEGMIRSMRIGWNENAIRATLLQKVSPHLDRPVGNVTIAQGSGGVVFDGVGLPGRFIDIDAASTLIVNALAQGVMDVWLPVTITQPQVTVTDPELSTLGIKEVVTVGESDMSNSPVNRRFNIAVGLKRFNGHLIKQGETFSFLKVLGPVDGTTGYRKELVINGDKTIPDFGGGLCQVSTTAYRGVWEYGFPIVKRVNHSYIVSHYAPYGTDATVFTSGPDLQFKNDSPGALLMQTYADGDNVYFIYYGTRDTRSTQVIGPYVWGRIGPPPPRTELTTDITPGTKRKVGDAVPGLRALWYRVVTKDGAQTIDDTYSIYGARPLFYQVGVVGLPNGSGEVLTPGDVTIGG